MSVYSSSIPRVVGPVQGIFIASSGSAVAIAFVVSQSPLLRRLEWRRRRERFRRVPAIGDGLRSSCSLRSVAVVDWRDSWKKASSAAPALDASEGATSGGDCPSLRRLGSSWSGAETGLMGVAACRCLGKMGGWPAGGMPRTWKLCPTKVPPRSGPQSPPSPERRGQKGWAGATLKSAPPPARPSSIRSPARESLTHSAIHSAPWAMHHHPPRPDDVLHSRARSRLGQMPSPIPRVSPPCHSMQTGGLQMMAYTNGSRLDVKADHQLAWKSRPAMG